MLCCKQLCLKRHIYVTKSNHHATIISSPILHRMQVCRATERETGISTPTRLVDEEDYIAFF